MRRFFLLMTALFAISAYLQRNDPDPWKWMGMYAFLALLSLLSALGKPARWGILAGLVACAALAVEAWPGFQEFLSNDDGIGLTQTMSNDYEYIEEGREFGGVAISTAALLVLLLHSLMRGRKSE